MKKVIITTLAVMLPAIALLTFFHPHIAEVNASTTPPGFYYVMVTPDSYYKIQGGSVMFTGDHFYPHEIVSIQTNSSVIATTQADSNGNFTTGWIRVRTISGRQIFTFVGNVSKIPFSVGISVGGTQPWLILSNYYEGAGMPLTINGHGFGSNEPVAVTFAGINEGTVETNSQGTFSLVITVPYEGAGTQIVNAHGLYTGSHVQATFSQAY